VTLSPSFHPAWLAAAGVMLLVGLWFLRRGWHGRRVGDEPFCKKCGYSLVGLERTRCPECGVDVSGDKNIRIGRLTRRPRAIIYGAAMAVIALTFLSVTGWPRLRDFDWYTLKPTGWVLDDLASVNSPNRARALAEMDRRLKGGPLAKHHHDRMVDIALAEQARITAALPRLIAGSSTLPPDPFSTMSPVTQGLVDWIVREAENGRLNPEHVARLCEQSQVLRVMTRPTIVEGNLPLTFQRERLGLPATWYVPVSEGSLSVDGRTLSDDEYRQAIESALYLRRPGVGSEYRERFWLLPLSGVGPHELAFKAHLEVWSAAGVGKEKTFIHGFDARYTATVQVVSSNSVQALPDTVFEEQIRGALGFGPFRVVNAGGVRQLVGRFELIHPPTNLCFQMAARIGGKEYPLGRLGCPAGGEASETFTAAYDGPSDVATFDLILRPDEAAARQSLNLTTIWDRELVVKDVMMRPLSRDIR
jgi:hypothetical protein